jgi:general secretion pathway protein L
MTQISTLITDWGIALRDSLPGGVRRALGLGRRYVVLEPEETAWHVSRTHGGAFDASDRVDHDQLVQRLRSRESPVVLALPEDLAMRSVLTLPDTARRSLDQVLDVEIERLTPFKSQDVAVAREIQSDADGQIRVELTIVPRHRVEECLAPLLAAGIRVDHVVVGRASVERASELDLRAGAGTEYQPSRDWLPALVTAALLVAAVVSPFVEQEQRIKELVTTLDALRPKADAVMRLAREVNILEARDRGLRSFAESRVSMTALLEETTRVLPDDTWLVRYQFGESKLNLEGRSSSATSLVNQLSASAWLADIQFQAPVTRDPSTGADRFRLGARVSRQ